MLPARRILERNSSRYCSHLRADTMSSVSSGVLGQSIPWPGLFAGAVILALTSIYCRTFFLRSVEEPDVDYEVPVPEQCKPGWQGEELDQVQLKACPPSTPTCTSASGSNADSRTGKRYPARARSNATVPPTAVLSAS